MQKLAVRILATLIVVFVAIQFWPSKRENPPGRFDGPIVSAALMPKFQAACYDCHSNRTTWPWYTQIQPFKLLAVYDVDKGREEVNFDDWMQMSEDQRVKALKKSAEEIAEGEMPPRTYLLMHPEAALDAETKARLADDLRKQAASLTP